MSDVCFNSRKFVKKWFINLEAMQERMADINHLTATNLKTFSHQTLDELLVSTSPAFQINKKNLANFCENNLQLLVPADAFDDLNKDFLSFLGYISVPAKDRMTKLFYCVAAKFNASLPDNPPPSFLSTKMEIIYSDEPFDNNPSLKCMDVFLKECLNVAFYNEDTILRDGTITVGDAISAILS